MIHVLLKLVSGDEIIGTVPALPDADTKRITIKWPLQVRFAQLGDAVGILLYEYDRLSKNRSITISSDKIIYVSEIEERMAEYYEVSKEYHLKSGREGFLDSIASATEALRKVVDGGLTEFQYVKQMLNAKPTEEEYEEDPEYAAKREEEINKAINNLLNDFDVKGKKAS